MGDPALVGIAIYPVKSCRGIALDRARVTRRGLAHDRRWMIADASGRFVTQREEPRLALVDVALEGATIALGAPGMPDLELAADDARAPIDATIWGDTVRTRAHAAGSAWMSRFLGRAVHVVHMPDTTHRALSPKHARPGDEVSLADGFPLLLASRASLDDLNARLDEPLGMERFRPNVVVEGARAWDEEAWPRLRIGALALRAPKGCERCTITTVDPSTGVAGKEPLRTLATFRKREGKVWFGMNLVPELGSGDTAEIALGDPIEPL